MTSSAARLGLTACVLSLFLAIPALACPIAKAVEIEWNGSDFPGVVLEGPDAQGHCLVSYDGWDETWNEWVAPSRIANIVAATPVPSACPTGASRQIEWNGSLWAGTILEGPNAEGACFVTYDGWDASWNEWVAPDRIAPVEVAAPASASCPVGAVLEIQWNDSWWDGAVLEGPNAAGECLVTYEGWDASWNEWVAPARLRGAN
ncbi:MBT domain-containing protein [Gymnodinialimonas sp.]